MLKNSDKMLDTDGCRKAIEKRITSHNIFCYNSYFL